MENYILLGIAVLNAFTAIMSYRTHVAAQRTEKNTNSMREQLVDSTKVSSHAEGLEEGRAEGAATAAILAKGERLGESRTK